MEKQDTQTAIIGTNILYHRLARGMTYDALAHRLYVLQNLSVKPTALKHYERKGRLPAATLAAIAAVMQVDVARFYDPPDAAILLDRNTLKLITAYKTIKHQGRKDAILYLTRTLASK